MVILEEDTVVEVVVGVGVRETGKRCKESWQVDS